MVHYSPRPGGSLSSRPKPTLSYRSFEDEISASLFVTDDRSLEQIHHKGNPDRDKDPFNTFNPNHEKVSVDVIQSRFALAGATTKQTRVRGLVLVWNVGCRHYCTNCQA